MPTIPSVDLGEFQDGFLSFLRLSSGRVIPLTDEGDASPSDEHYRRASELSTNGGATPAGGGAQ